MAETLRPRIAILIAGAPPEALAARFGSYADMLETLLAGDGRRFAAYDATAGVYPEPGAFDALVVTGSPAGVYDPEPWITPLKEFLRRATGVPMVGVCFGHQVMAEAFGGRVEKSDKGWGIGLHRYAVTERAAWMDPDVDAVSIPASHQDQVVAAPPGARIVAASAFTPVAALAYDDRPAISFQGHPEFTSAFAAALIELRRGVRYAGDVADAAIESLAAPNDNAMVGRWIVRFLLAAVAERESGGSRRG